MKKVLIVEDDSEIRVALEEILTSVGIVPISAANGQMGLDYLRCGEELPDLILLDIMMPVKDGYQFRAEQLTDEKLKTIPVIVMTAYQDIDRKRIGEVTLMKKPVEIETLFELVKK